MANKVAVIAAHPDDEILRCGGAMACHALPGDEVRVLILAEGVTSRDAERSRGVRSDDIAELREATRAANGALGVNSECSPNWFVEITSTLERKLAALSAYATEMRPWPHPRSLKAVEHLSRWRGATVRVEAAEAFMLGREIASSDPKDNG